MIPNCYYWVAVYKVRLPSTIYREFRGMSDGRFFTGESHLESLGGIVVWGYIHVH